jgi:predicted nucleic acid-binding Zn ribbon protein
MFNKEDRAFCATCSDEMHRVPATFTATFKGSGFYTTDYAKKTITKEDL